MTITTTNSIKTVKANASAFIIPNSACVVSKFLNPERMIVEAKSICEANGMQFNESDKMIQVWIHSEDLSTENLQCHGGTFKEGGIRFHIDCSYTYIPESFFRGHKEMDVISLKIPCMTAILNTEDDNWESIHMILDLNLTLQQQGYRYSNHGNFEDTLLKVTC